MMESEEAARRLGVKLTTLYAYVSRGLLQSHPSPRRGRRLFDAAEVEALARRARGGKQVETRVATVTTAITQLRPDGPYYRGTSAVELAESSSFERAAELLWGAAPGQWQPRALRPPAELRAADRLRWVVLMVAAADEHRADPSPALVTQRLRTLIATMAAVSGARRALPSPARTRLIATLLADRLTERTEHTERTGHAGRSVVRAVDAALVLLTDHELATSTLAVRVAASTRANVYDALLAGLSTLAGPLHGGAGSMVCRLLYRAEREGAGSALDELLITQRVLPGFGHVVYPDGDPRGASLLRRVKRLARGPQRKVIDAVLDLARHRQQPPPNLDFALAALAYATGMAPEAVATLFAIARTAGWGGHYLEELNEQPLRYRARAIYTSAPVSSP